MLNLKKYQTVYLIALSFILSLILIIPFEISAKQASGEVYIAGQPETVEQIFPVFEEKGIPAYKIVSLNRLIKDIETGVIRPGNLLIVDWIGFKEVKVKLSEIINGAVQRGVITVFYGKGSEILREIVKIERLPELPKVVTTIEIIEKPAEKEKVVPVELAPIMAYGLWTDGEIQRLLETPVNANLAISDFDLSYIITYTYEWYEGVLGNAATLFQEAKERGSPPAWSKGLLRQWDWSNTLKPFGRLNFWGGWKKIKNDGDGKYDWYSIDFHIQSVPGDKKWGQWWDYRTDYVITKADLDKITQSGYIYDYYPSTTVTGYATNTYTVTAGTTGGSASYSRSTVIPDYRVEDCGDKSEQLVCWRQVFREGTHSAERTFHFKPTVVDRVNNGVIPWASTYLEAQWCSWWRKGELKYYFNL